MVRAGFDFIRYQRYNQISLAINNTCVFLHFSLKKLRWLH